MLIDVELGDRALETVDGHHERRVAVRPNFCRAVLRPISRQFGKVVIAHRIIIVDDDPTSACRRIARAAVFRIEQTNCGRICEGEVRRVERDVVVRRGIVIVIDRIVRCSSEQSGETRRYAGDVEAVAVEDRIGGIGAVVCELFA